MSEEFNDDYADTAIVCENGEIVKYSAYIMSNISEYFATLLRFNPEKMREDAEKLGLKNIKYIINIPNFPADFVKRFLKSYATLGNCDGLPLNEQFKPISEESESSNTLEFYEMFAPFCYKYITKNTINYAELFDKLVRIGGYKDEYVDIMFRYCTNGETLTRIIADIYKYHDDRIYAKLPQHAKESVAKYGTFSLEDYCYMIYQRLIKFHDIHETTRNELANYLKNCLCDIRKQRITVPIDNYQSNNEKIIYSVLLYLDFLEEKCGIETGYFGIKESEDGECISDDNEFDDE